MKEFLYTLYRSLDALTVRGKDNMAIVLGCMDAIAQKISEIEADEQIPGPIIDESEVSEDG